MSKINLVTGANGHLGNNLVRRLLQKGEKVRASVRNVNNKEPFRGLECDIVYADMLDRESLLKVMNNVDTLYACAAVYKSWAKDTQKEIIDVNMKGTENVMEVAALQGVRRTVYVSSTYALDHSKVPVNETGWSHDRTDPYGLSKTEAEKLAWNLAKKHGLWMVSILPSGMIGPHCYSHLTATMELLSRIMKNQLPFDPTYNFNLVDIRDVADTMIVAAEKGKNGERYILAQEKPISSTEIFELAHSLYPKVKVPSKLPYALMFTMASLMEGISRITGKKPLMLRSQVRSFYKSDYRCDISKAKRDLGFNPRTTTEALKETLVDES